MVHIFEQHNFYIDLHVKFFGKQKKKKTVVQLLNWDAEIIF